MKKLMMVIVALILMMNTSFSQSRISTSYDELLKEYPLGEYVSQDTTDDGQKYITVQYSNYDATHYFNNSDYVTITAIFYKDSKSLNKKIQSLNDMYVCEAKNEEDHGLRWADYSFGYIITIKFIATDNLQVIRYSVD